MSFLSRPAIFAVLALVATTASNEARGAATQSLTLAGFVGPRLALKILQRELASVPESGSFELARLIEIKNSGDNYSIKVHSSNKGRLGSAAYELLCDNTRVDLSAGLASLPQNEQGEHVLRVRMPKPAAQTSKLTSDTLTFSVAAQ